MRSYFQWVYRWEGHEMRVQIRRDTHPWDRLYLDGALAAEQQGWHFFPVTLAAKVEDVGRDNHDSRVRVG